MFKFKSKKAKEARRQNNIGFNSETLEIIVIPYSEAEGYFIKQLMPLCKDKNTVACRLGIFYPDGLNRYVLSSDDFNTVLNAVKSNMKQE